MDLERLDQLYTKLTPNKVQWNEDKKDTSLETLLSPIRFKTGGMRGLMREGFNGINEVTANILATQLCKRFRSVVIGYDHRMNSERLAYVFLRIFALGNRSVRVYRHCITPYLAMESRLYDAGVMITASHNPREYNGFKIYCKGTQITTDVAQSIHDSLKTHEFTEIYDRDNDAFKGTDWREYLETHTSPIDFNRYFSSYGIELSADRHTVIPIFSALYGVSSPFIREACKHFGIKMNTGSRHNRIDGNFPQVPFPNPEVEENWYALHDEMFSDRTQDGLLFMIDPDGDRFGMASVEGGRITIHNANSIAKIFTWYFLKKYHPSEIVLVNTFLCDGFFKAVSEKLGIRYRQTETGFKNVSRGIRELLDEPASPHAIGQSVQALQKKLADTSIDEKRSVNHVIAYEDPLGFVLGNPGEKDGVLASIVMYHILQEHRISDIFDEMGCFGAYASYTVHLRVADPERMLDRVVRIKSFGRIYDAYMTVEDKFLAYLRVSGTESMIKIYMFSSQIGQSELREIGDWWILKNVMCFCRSE